MKRGCALLLLSLAPAWCQVAKPAALTGSTLPTPRAARIPLDSIKEMERTFNERLPTVAGLDDPAELMGDTRGVQLEDYGVVFTSEISLVMVPGLMPFRPKISPEMAARIHKQRVARLPLLKTAMKEMLRSMAIAFNQVPDTQQMVLVVRLYYGAWEDTTGMPSQIVMRADRASASTGKIETEER